MRQMETAKAMMRQREAGGATWGQDFSEADDYAQVVRAGLKGVDNRTRIPLSFAVTRALSSQDAPCGTLDVPPTTHPCTAGFNLSLPQVRAGPAFDWKTYSGPLNEKQEKVKEKLVKKDLALTNLRSEIQRIQAKKDSQDGGLTQGQEMQVARNEQRIEQLEEEIDMLGETPAATESGLRHADDASLSPPAPSFFAFSCGIATVQPRFLSSAFLTVLNPAAAAEQLEESVTDAATKRSEPAPQKRKKARRWTDKTTDKQRSQSGPYLCLAIR